MTIDGHLMPYAGGYACVTLRDGRQVLGVCVKWQMTNNNWDWMVLIRNGIELTIAGRDIDTAERVHVVAGDDDNA